MTETKTTQNQRLEDYLRGTGKNINAMDARSMFGIKNIRARMTELRKNGLKVLREVDESGNSAYSVSSRDVNGSRARVF